MRMRLAEKIAKKSHTHPGFYSAGQLHAAGQRLSRLTPGGRWFLRVVARETPLQRAKFLTRFGFIGEAFRWLVRTPEGYWNTPIKEFKNPRPTPQPPRARAAGVVSGRRRPPGTGHAGRGAG